MASKKWNRCRFFISILNKVYGLNVKFKLNYVHMDIKLFGFFKTTPKQHSTKKMDIPHFLLHLPSKCQSKDCGPEKLTFLFSPFSTPRPPEVEERSELDFFLARFFPHHDWKALQESVAMCFLKYGGKGF